MLAMCDEKEILRDYIESEKYEAAKEAATATLEGRTIGRADRSLYISIIC